MTSPPRGPAPHPLSRGDAARAGLAAQRLDRVARGQSSGRLESARAERLPQSRAEAPQRRPPQAMPRGEEALREAALAAAGVNRSAVRYRGFVLLPQPDLGWLVRPERSPMTVLPFRTPPISLSDVKALVDWRLDGTALTPPLQDRRRG